MTTETIGRTGIIPVARISTSSSAEGGAKVGRLSEILNNKVIPKSLILMKKSPKVKGSALLLRIYREVTGRRGVLCVSNRRSRARVGLHTGHVNRFDRGLLLLYRAGLKVVHDIVRGRGPRLIVVSSVRAVCDRRIGSTPKDISRIHRSAGMFVRLTGKLYVPVFVINRIAGRKAITNPHILRRVISAMLCFRKSHRTSCQVLETIGGHFNSAGRVNIFRVERGKLMRMRGPSRCVLDKGPRGTSNSIMTYSVRKAHPVLLRVRTLITEAGFNVPEEATTKASCGEIGLLVTMLRGQLNVGLKGYSTCMGVTNKVGVGRPTVSLKVIVTLISDCQGHPVSRGAVIFNRINLDNRMHTIGVPRRHITRTGGLKFRAYVLPRIYVGAIGSIGKVGLLNIGDIGRTITVF